MIKFLIGIFIGFFVGICIGGIWQMRKCNFEGANLFEQKQNLRLAINHIEAIKQDLIKIKLSENIVIDETKKNRLK